MCRVEGEPCAREGPGLGQLGCPSVGGWAQGENEITAGSLLGGGANEYIVHSHLLKLSHLFRGRRMESARFGKYWVAQKEAFES